MAQRKARHSLWRHFPHASRARLARVAATLPPPDPRAGPLQAVARHVRVLQEAIHGGDADSARQGCFRFLGRTIDFGGIEKIEWRRTLDESSSPLWRLTLAYFGWAVPILAAGDPAGQRLVAQALRHLERTVSWAEPGVFRDVWNPYTASHRLINLLAGLSLAPARPANNDTRILLDHVRFCATFVAADLERDLQVNHLFKNYTALAVYSAAAGGDTTIWPDLAQAVPRGLEQLVLDDGGHVERSPMYHALGLLDMRMLRDCAVFVDAWQPDLDGRIAAAEQALRCMAHPDGDIALFNDSWLGGAPDLRAFDLPASTSGRHDLAITGYSRIEGGSDCVILDCGPLGPDFNPGHGHADFLALEASVGGQRLIVDTGTPTYVAGPERDLCRSASHHNGPHLSGCEPVEFWKSFRVGRRATAGLLADPQLAVAPLWTAGWHDAYRQQNVEARRWIGLWPGYGLIVVDLWQGSAANPVSAFHVGPDFSPDGADGRRFRGRCTVLFEALAGTLSRAGSAPYWPRYGEESVATRLHLQPENRSPTAGLAVIWGEGRSPWQADIVDALAPVLARAARVDNSSATVYGDRL